MYEWLDGWLDYSILLLNNNTQLNWDNTSFTISFYIYFFLYVSFLYLKILILLFFQISNIKFIDFSITLPISLFICLLKRGRGFYNERGKNLLFFFLFLLVSVLSCFFCCFCCPLLLYLFLVGQSVSCTGRDTFFHCLCHINHPLEEQKKKIHFKNVKIPCMLVSFSKTNFYYSKECITFRSHHKY